jgi:hypothetical protein
VAVLVVVAVVRTGIRWRRATARDCSAGREARGQGRDLAVSGGRASRPHHIYLHSRAPLHARSRRAYTPAGLAHSCATQEAQPAWAPPHSTLASESSSESAADRSSGVIVVADTSGGRASVCEAARGRGELAPAAAAWRFSRELLRTIVWPACPCHGAACDRLLSLLVTPSAAWTASAMGETPEGTDTKPPCPCALCPSPFPPVWCSRKQSLINAWHPAQPPIRPQPRGRGWRSGAPGEARSAGAARSTIARPVPSSGGSAAPSGASESAPIEEPSSRPAPDAARRGTAATAASAAAPRAAASSPLGAPPGSLSSPTGAKSLTCSFSSGGTCGATRERIR